ncbi:MAG: FadR/GntR family transcriptional regulator [Thermoleophilia bacterium]
MARSKTSAPELLISPFREVATRRTYEEAINQIADAVRLGDIAVGERLPSERTLADMMAVSRPTVREAIGALVEVGVLETRSGGGTMVKTDIVPTDLIVERAELKIGEVAGVLEARRLLEPRVAQLAALYMDDDDLKSLRATIELLRGGADSRERFVLFELRFHMAVARATKNSMVVELMRALFKRLELVRDMAMHAPDEAGRAIDIHERTLAAICGGDPDAIDEAMDEHLAYLERLWELETNRARLRRVPDFLLPRSARGLTSTPG